MGRRCCCCLVMSASLMLSAEMSVVDWKIVNYIVNRHFINWICHKAESFLVKSVFQYQTFVSVSYRFIQYLVSRKGGLNSCLLKSCCLWKELEFSSHTSLPQKPHARDGAERDNSLEAFCSHGSLTNLAVKILTQSLWMQVIVKRICFTLETSALIILFKDTFFKSE